MECRGGPHYHHTQAVAGTEFASHYLGLASSDLGIVSIPIGRTLSACWATDSSTMMQIDASAEAYATMSTE